MKPSVDSVTKKSLRHLVRSRYFRYWNSATKMDGRKSCLQRAQPQFTTWNIIECCRGKWRCFGSTVTTGGYNKLPPPQEIRTRRKAGRFWRWFKRLWCLDVGGHSNVVLFRVIVSVAQSSEVTPADGYQLSKKSNPVFRMLLLVLNWGDRDRDRGRQMWDGPSPGVPGESKHLWL